MAGEYLNIAGLRISVAQITQLHDYDSILREEFAKVGLIPRYMEDAMYGQIFTHMITQEKRFLGLFPYVRYVGEIVQDLDVAGQIHPDSALRLGDTLKIQLMDPKQTQNIQSVAKTLERRLSRPAEVIAI